MREDTYNPCSSINERQKDRYDIAEKLVRGDPPKGNERGRSGRYVTRSTETHPKRPNSVIHPKR